MSVDLNTTIGVDLESRLAGLERQMAFSALGQVGGANGLEALLGSKSASDIYQLKQKAPKVDTKGAKTAGDEPNTSPPHANFSHNAAQTAGTYYAPLEQVGRVQLTDAKGKPSGKAFSGAHLKASLDACKDPTRKAAFMQKYNVTQTADGNYVVPVQSAGALNIAGVNGNATAQSIAGMQNRTSWALPMIGMATGGVGGLIGGLVGAKALKGAAGGLGAGGMAPGLLAAGLGSGSSALSTVGGYAGWGGGAMASSIMGMNGMAYNMRMQMTSLARQMKMDSLVAMCQNPGIPIEDLIAMFMAYMGEAYDGKLREKIEETARAEKREEQREQEKKQGNFLGGLARASGGLLGMIVPGVGMAAQAAGGAIEMATDARIMAEDAAGGFTKSSTILMQEVQILMNKWKQVNELFSNLLKTLHDMAMTPIRNLR